jgi:hypothetical protein
VSSGRTPDDPRRKCSSDSRRVQDFGEFCRYHDAIPASHSAVPVDSGPPRDAGGAAGAAPPVAAARFDRFILGRFADPFFFGPGATIVVAGTLLALPRLGAGAAALAGTLTVMLTFLLVGPHYAATYRRAYTSREIIRAHPWVTLAVPAALFGAALLAVRHPTTVGLAYFGLYVAWSGYHYSGQSLGLAMLYPLRQGARLAPREKRLISLPLYVSWLLSLAGLFRLSSSVRNPAYEAVRRAYSGPPLPGWGVAIGFGVLAVSLLGVVHVARARRARGTPLPWPTYAVLSAQIAWFTIGLYQPLFNILLVPMFHSLQYLALTSWHATREPGGAGLKRFAVTLFVVLALGLVINPGLFVMVRGADAASTLVATAAVTTFVNLHHFLLDGRIWRLRERRVVQTMIA